MSANFVLPTLTNWTEGHITAIIQAKTQQDLQTAVDAFLSKNATINVNGAQLTRDAFVQQLSGENFDEQAATVDFNASVEAIPDGSSTFTGGSVGLSYTAVIQEALRVLGGPVTTNVTASLNVVVAQDPSIPQPPPNPDGIRGFPIFDGRRVMALNEVRLQTRVNIPPTTS